MYTITVLRIAVMSQLRCRFGILVDASLHLPILADSADHTQPAVLADASMRTRVALGQRVRSSDAEMSDDPSVSGVGAALF